MADFADIQPGLVGHARLEVGEAQLATAVGSGNVTVLATPVMVALMEAAAVDAVDKLLPDGFTSLGAQLDITHSSPTPPGLTVTAAATVKSVDGRKVVFDVSAHDGVEEVGGGTHVRVIVDRPRFEARLAAKLLAVAKG